MLEMKEVELEAEYERARQRERDWARDWARGDWDKYQSINNYDKQKDKKDECKDKEPKKEDCKDKAETKKAPDCDEEKDGIEVLKKYFTGPVGTQRTRTFLKFMRLLSEGQEDEFDLHFRDRLSPLSHYRRGLRRRSSSALDSLSDDFEPLEWLRSSLGGMGKSGHGKSLFMAASKNPK